MFPVSYFPHGAFAPRYFPNAGAEPAEVVPGLIALSVVEVYSIALSATEIYSIDLEITMSTSDLGDMVRIKGAFRNALTGRLTDPTNISLKVRTPSGTTTTYAYGGSSMVRESTGVYYYDYTPSEAGSYFYKFIGSGAVVAVEEGLFSIATTSIT